MNFDELFTETSGTPGNVSQSSKGELINIQNIEDLHARYKMPKLQSRIKDKGKFAETFVCNLPEIAKALKINLSALLKFVESSLGSQFMLADKKDLSSYYIKGRFSYEQLYEPLRAFIDQYVLCSKCGLPELEYKKEGSKEESKEGKDGSKDDKGKCSKLCKSCGTSTRIDPKDRIYKLLV